MPRRQKEILMNKTAIKPTWKITTSKGVVKKAPPKGVWYTIAGLLLVLNRMYVLLDGQFMSYQQAYRRILVVQKKIGYLEEEGNVLLFSLHLGDDEMAEFTEDGGSQAVGDAVVTKVYKLYGYDLESSHPFYPMTEFQKDWNQKSITQARDRTVLMEVTKSFIDTKDECPFKRYVLTTEERPFVKYRGGWLV